MPHHGKGRRGPNRPATDGNLVAPARRRTGASSRLVPVLTVLWPKRTSRTHLHRALPFHGLGTKGRRLAEIDEVLGSRGLWRQNLEVGEQRLQAGDVLAREERLAGVVGPPLIDIEPEQP